MRSEVSEFFRLSFETPRYWMGLHIDSDMICVGKNVDCFPCRWSCKRPCITSSVHFMTVGAHKSCLPFCNKLLCFLFFPLLENLY